jgi:hypothetical protein
MREEPYLIDDNSENYCEVCSTNMGFSIEEFHHYTHNILLDTYGSLIKDNILTDKEIKIKERKAKLDEIFNGEL